MRVMAIIPARAGSKGIPRKNLIKVAGKPLIWYSIQAALQSQVVDEVFVSSDSDEILSYARSLGVNTIQRPAELAEDLTPTDPVIVHALQHTRALDKRFDWFVLLQPTSPLRSSEDIDAAFQHMRTQRGNSLISVCATEKNHYKSLMLDDSGNLKGLVNDQAPFMPRQSCPETYAANGAIYIYNVDHFLTTKKFGFDNTIPYVMDATKSIDVDNINDLHLIEKAMNNDETS